jgi:transcriptional regulator with XRE-family HTH domain
VQDQDGRPVSPLRAERDAQGLRLKDVAALAGCSISLVSMVESGYIPPLHRREGIARALGASVGSFWQSNGNGSPP